MDNEEHPRKKARTCSSLTASIGDLLSTGKYSDLDIRCGGKSFRVHRNIVCGRSKVMDKECDGGFLESHTRIIKHTVFDSFAMDRMLQFMYRSDYQLELACPTSPDPDTMIEDPETSIEDEVPASSPSAAAAVDELANEASAEPKAENELIAHVYVYAIADYYELPTLRDLAVQKFKAAREMWESISPENLVNLASVVYTSTTEEAAELRHELFSLAWDNPWSSVDSQTFMTALATQPELQELAADLITKTTRLHRASEHALQADAKELRRSNEEYDTFQDTMVRTIKVHEHELRVKRREVLDLTYFAAMKNCTGCNSEHPFTYSVEARSKEKGFAAKCWYCKKRYTRTSTD